MNATVKPSVLSHHSSFAWKTWFLAFTQKQRALIFVLMGLLLASSFSVIYLTNFNRQLVIQQQELLAAKSKLHSEWSQLLLEQGAYSNQARIADRAKQKMGMEIPEASDMLVVNAL